MILKDKIIWVTGASSGIGEAVVKAYAAAGAKVVLSARNSTSLNQIKNKLLNPDKCLVVPLDLADSSSIAKAVTIIIDAFGTVDILINNGGISQRSLVNETPLEIDRRVMEVNFFGTIALTKAVLPYMEKQKSGHIATVSSVVGLFGFPLRSAYSSSKHALHGFFESLALEQYKNNIQVTIVCPGRVKTNISINAITKDGSKHGVMDHGQNDGITAESCANQIVKSIQKRKRLVLIGGKETFLARIKRISPWAYFKIALKVNPI